MIRYLLTAVLATLPASMFAGIVFVSFDDGAYYTRPWQIAAVVYLVASFLLGLRIPARPPADELDAASRIRQRFFVYPVLAWILAVAILFVLSFTPLVLGQDNGDGANGYPECLFFAISSSTVYSGFVLLVISLNSLLVTPLFRLGFMKHPPSS